MPAAVSPIARPSVGRTFIVAISLLGCIALGQIGAVAWMFIGRFATLTERAKLGPMRIVTTTAPPATPAPGDLAATATLEARDPFEEVQRLPSSEPIAPPPKPVPVSSAKLNPQAPPETRYQELVLTGKQLRERGDTAAALVKLREAMALEPQDPEAIAELAVTFERISLMDKAAEQWKRIFEMGPDAGSFYIAAESRMKMSQAQAIAAAASVQPAAVEGAVSRLKADAILGIGDIAKQDKPESGGTRFALRVPVKAKRGEQIGVADVDIHVLFYDIIDGKTPVQTSADVSYRFASAPIDWSTSDPETLEVEYSQQPPLATGPKTEKREYHGYIVRVYYKGQLQDLRAEPETLNAKFPAPQTLESNPPNKK